MAEDWVIVKLPEEKVWTTREGTLPLGLMDR